MNRDIEELQKEIEKLKDRVRDLEQSFGELMAFLRMKEGGK
jgi:cell division protein FtsB